MLAPDVNASGCLVSRPPLLLNTAWRADWRAHAAVSSVEPNGDSLQNRRSGVRVPPPLLVEPGRFRVAKRPRGFPDGRDGFPLKSAQNRLRGWRLARSWRAVAEGYSAFSPGLAPLWVLSVESLMGDVYGKSSGSS